MYGSILLPVRNGEKFLTQALDSVSKAAGSQPYELVIQDGLSTDRTREIVSAHPANIRYARERDHGQTDALNRALRRSTGDFVGWLNADDTYAPLAIERAAQVFRDSADTDIVFGNFTVIDENSAVLREHHPGEWSWKRLYMKGNYIFSGATFFRRDVFERFAPLDTQYEYGADFEFFLRIGAFVNATYVDSEFGAYRYHTQSKSGSQRFRFCAEAASVRRQHRPSGALDGWLAYARAQSEAWIATAVMPLRYTGAYSRARRFHAERRRSREPERET
jgi:glycosyltransferase involved in cell wall biosynthesis